MTIVDLIAWILMAAGLLRASEARDEYERSVALERWLVTVMLNGTALALWNVTAGPIAAFRHWLLALGVLTCLRLLLRTLRRQSVPPALLSRAAPAAAALGPQGLYGRKP
ncbi:MAG: hypothetical protein QM661_13330 [Solimonas sp.]